MAENKKSFVLYSDLIITLEHLTNEEKGLLFNHLLMYVNDMNPVLEDRLLLTAWRPIEAQLKRDLEKYKEVKQKRSDAGKKGGINSGHTRSKLNQDEAIEANASFVKQTEANEAVTDNDTVNVNDTDNDILLEKETKGENQDFLQSEISEEKEIPQSVNPETEETKKVAQKKVKFKPPSLQEVQDYCNERQNGIQAFTFVNFYQSKGWLIGKNPMKDWKAAIHTWESKNKENGKPNYRQSTTGTIQPVKAKRR